MNKKIISLEQAKMNSNIKKFIRRRIIRKVIYSVLISLSLIIGISMIVLYNFGDRIFDEVIKAQLIAERQLDKQSASASDEQDKDNNVNEDNKNVEDNSKAQENDNTAVDINEDDKSNTEVKSNPDAAKEPDSTEKPAQQDSKGNDTGDAAGNTKDNVNPKVDEEYIDPAKIQEISNKVTAQDKVRAGVLVASRLTAAERNELQGMLSGGVTEEEKKRAKEIAYSKFTEAEIKEIFDLYHKYMNPN